MIPVGCDGGATTTVDGAEGKGATVTEGLGDTGVDEALGDDEAWVATTMRRTTSADRSPATASATANICAWGVAFESNESNALGSSLAGARGGRLAVSSAGEDDDRGTRS